MPLFDRYLFADYSGGGEHNHAQSVRVHTLQGSAGNSRGVGIRLKNCSMVWAMKAKAERP